MFCGCDITRFEYSGFPWIFSRRHDSSIGFRAQVRSNMRTGGVTNAEITSSLLESVSKIKEVVPFSMVYSPLAPWKSTIIIVCFAFLVDSVVFKTFRMPFLQVESGDLIAYGLIPEFVGRFPILVSLSSLSEDQLVEVFLSFLSHLHVTGPISF